MSLDGNFNTLINLFIQCIPIAFSCSIGRLREVNGDILKPAETHTLWMFNHVIIIDGCTQTAACGERNLIPIEDEIRDTVFAGNLTCVFQEFVLFWVVEGIFVNVEITLLESKRMPIAVSLAPYVKHSQCKLPGGFFIIPIGFPCGFATGSNSRNIP